LDLLARIVAPAMVVVGGPSGPLPQGMMRQRRRLRNVAGGEVAWNRLNSAAKAHAALAVLHETMFPQRLQYVRKLP